MSGHTPGPWKVSLTDETLILGPDRQCVATTLQEEEDYRANCDRRAADAELIVRAVNAHEPLLAALKLAQGHLTEQLDCKRCHPIGHCPVLDSVNAAIAKAEQP